MPEHVAPADFWRGFQGKLKRLLTGQVETPPRSLPLARDWLLFLDALQGGFRLFIPLPDVSRERER